MIASATSLTTTDFMTLLVYTCLFAFNILFYTLTWCLCSKFAKHIYKLMNYKTHVVETSETLRFWF